MYKKEPRFSWASLLMDATDMGNLAVPVPPEAASRMYSSCLDSNKVMLANLAPKILGDMDHGFFKEVVEDKDGVKATLAEFDGPGVVTWVWSANPTSHCKLVVWAPPKKNGRTLRSCSVIGRQTTRPEGFPTPIAV
jgi:hypothetical protein